MSLTSYPGQQRMSLTSYPGHKGNPVVFVFQIKCHQYYPVGEENEGDDEIIFTEVGLKVTFLSEQIVNYHYVVRMLEIKDLQVFFVR